VLILPLFQKKNYHKRCNVTDNIVLFNYSNYDIFIPLIYLIMKALKTPVFNHTFKGFFNSALLLIIIIYCSSCAAVVMGSKQRVDVYSDPPGARVFLNGNDTKKVTPAIVNVKRKSGYHTFKFEREGYEDYSYELQSRFNALVVLDFCMWLFPGFIDVSVGAQHIYDKGVFAKMQKTQSAAQPVLALAPEQGYTFKKLSDVDVSIPETGKNFSNRFALIIGNEDYTIHQPDMNSEINVDFAREDASAFKEYAAKTLGIPERNITILLDATTGEMRQGLSKMNLIAKNSGGNAEFFVFYAGHGLPDEETKEPFLMPVDVNGKFVKLGIPLKEFYNYFSEYPVKRTTVFLDACFSGGARNQGLVAARGVRVVPKNEMVKGNMVVFTASAGDESALPYVKKNHGLFTYYLLQKLKDTQADLSYKELSQFLEEHVSLESVIVNDKEQHPKTILSTEVAETWEAWKFR
jgi:hypothetical protein